MKFIFIILLLSTISLTIISLMEIRRKNTPKKSALFLLPIVFITAGSGYLYSLQHESDQNMKVIHDYFVSKCDGYLMRPMENPIEVEACGNSYLVKAKNGNIIMLETVGKQTE